MIRKSTKLGSRFIISHTSLDLLFKDLTETGKRTWRASGTQGTESRTRTETKTPQEKFYDMAKLSCLRICCLQEVTTNYVQDQKYHPSYLVAFLPKIPVVILQLLLWDPKHGRRSRGRPARTFIDQLESDSGLSRHDMILHLSLPTDGNAQ